MIRSSMFLVFCVFLVGSSGLPAQEPAEVPAEESTELSAEEETPRRGPSVAEWLVTRRETSVMTGCVDSSPHKGHWGGIGGAIPSL